MTSNQIKWLEAQEAARANKAREIETNRANLAKETETNRSNLENERMAREKWDYEKYGSGKGTSGVGGTIRTIKAAINDATKVADKLNSEMDKVNRSESATNQRTIEEVFTGNSGPVKVGGVDFAKVQSDIKSSKPKPVGELWNPDVDYTSYSAADLSKALAYAERNDNEKQVKAIKAEMAKRADERKVKKERGLTK